MYRDQIQFPVSPFLVLHSRFQKISFETVINGYSDFFKNEKIELIHEFNVEQTGVLHLLRRCFCLLLNSAQKVEEYTCRKLQEEQVLSASCTADSIAFRPGTAQCGGYHWCGMAELWQAKASFAESHFWWRNRMTERLFSQLAWSMQYDFLIALTESVSKTGEKYSTRKQQWRDQIFVHIKKQKNKKNNNNPVK